MEPQDILVQRIAAYVATQVPPEQRVVVTRAVVMTVATLMADPAFTEELVIVKALRNENQWLKTNYLILKQMMDQVGVRVKAGTSSAKPRKRSAAPRKSGTKRAGSSTASAKRASPQRPKPSAPNSSFRQGYNETRG